MAFTRTITWTDGSGGGTPLTALRLNAAWQEAGDYADTVVSAAAPSYLTSTGGGKDVYATNATAGASATVDLALGNEHRLTLTSASCTLTLTGATSGKVCTVTIGLTQDATGGRDVVWPGSIVWISSIKPYLLASPASSTDYVTLTTYDGGTTWFGSHSTTFTAELNKWPRPTLLEPWPSDENTSVNVDALTATGRTIFTLFRSPVTMTVSKFVTFDGGTVPTAPTLIRWGLFSVPESFTGNMTLLANTANLATAGADEYTGNGTLNASNVAALRTAFAEYRAPMDTGLGGASSVGMVAGKLYANSYSWQGTTAGRLPGKAQMGGTTNRAWGIPRSLLYGALTDITSTVAISTGTGTGVALWIAFSA